MENVSNFSFDEVQQYKAKTTSKLLKSIALTFVNQNISINLLWTLRYWQLQNQSKPRKTQSKLFAHILWNSEALRVEGHWINFLPYKTISRMGSFKLWVFHFDGSCKFVPSFFHKIYLWASAGEMEVIYNSELCCISSKYFKWESAVGVRNIQKKMRVTCWLQRIRIRLRLRILKFPRIWLKTKASVYKVLSHPRYLITGWKKLNREWKHTNTILLSIHLLSLWINF